MKNQLKIKVCGMRESANLTELLTLKPDYVGFIFVEQSPRSIEKDEDAEKIIKLCKAPKKVGVFVNRPYEDLVKLISQYRFAAVQLHGEEDYGYCAHLRKKFPELEIIKAVPVENTSAFERLAQYTEYCSHFLFDTRLPPNPEGTEPGQFGGTGKAFNWEILRNYRFRLPFFISGGIGPENITKVLGIVTWGLPFYGIDMNSKVESSPGVKDIALVRQVINGVRS